MERESIYQDKKNITEVTKNIKPKQTKLVLSDPDVKKHLVKHHQ